MRGNWIKIVLFVLVLFMLAGITQVMLDPGLGSVDESRRTKHPAGFSVVPPRGWGASVFYATPSSPDALMRVSPERSTGRQPSIGFIRAGRPVTPSPDAVPMTFQGQPATKRIIRTRHTWTWRMDFERNGVPFFVEVIYPVQTEVEGGPLWPFIESFRVEPVLNLVATTLPATMPAESTPPLLPTTRP